MTHPAPEFTEGKLELLIQAFGQAHHKPGNLARRAYKDTSAGVWIAIEVWNYGHDYDAEPYTKLLTEINLNQYETWEDFETAWVGVNYIEIGCIIEGSDACPETERLYLKDYTDPAVLEDDFWTTVELVDREACFLSDEIEEEEEDECEDNPYNSDDFLRPDHEPLGNHHNF